MAGSFVPALRGCSAPAAAETTDGASAEFRAKPPTFEDVYDQHFALVWRGLHAQGLDGAALDDAVQDVFLTVHRRLPTFEHRSEITTWLYGIVRHVAFNHLRRYRRKGGGVELLPTLASSQPGPDQIASDHEALRFLQRFLTGLDEAKRQVFLLCEVEQLPAPEVSRALGVKLNTVYSRLRAARREFARAVAARKGKTP
jgi:RNA polymerase sigma-70 factor (ECF subfamily)